MVDLKTYAGVYRGEVKGWGVTLTLRLTEEGKNAYIFEMGGEEYLSFIGTHSAKGDVLSIRVKDIFGVKDSDKDGYYTNIGRLYIGKKVVIEDDKYGDVELLLVAGEKPELPEGDPEPGQLLPREPKQPRRPEEVEAIRLAKLEEKKKEKEEFERTHPLRKLLFEGNGLAKIGGAKLPKERFLYVFGQKQYFYIQGMTVNVYGFVALTDKAEARVLPIFFHAGTDNTMPWAEAIKECAKYGDIDDFFIMSSSGDALKNALQEVKPKAKWFSMIWNLPQDAPIKKVAERLCSDFENDFKRFWRFKSGIESFEQAEATAKEYILALENLLKEKNYPSLVEIIAPSAVAFETQPAQPQKTAVTETQSAQPQAQNIAVAEATPVAQAGKADATEKPPASKAQKPAVTLTLDKKCYLPANMITVSVNGITEELNSARAFLGTYKAGAPHEQYGNYAFPDVGNTQVFFYAGYGKGEYEVRLYSKFGQYDDSTFVCSVPFSVI